jgi:cytochrome c oxidase subunit 2
MFRYLPEQASEHAAAVDWIHNLITDLSVFFTVLIVGAMLYFAIRYRRRNGKDHDTPRIEGSHTLEIVWTVVPTIVSIFLAYYGVHTYQAMRAVPENALTINVWGQKWQWSFEYENGKKFGGKDIEFVVPVDQQVKLVMQSRDVLHSFFIPAMRVKMDVVPGKYTYLTFKPIKTGTYPVFCTEYCGLEHSNMMASLRVVSSAEYERWVNDRSAEMALSNLSPAERGKSLYASKGCNACHSLDGNRVVGPSFLKAYGRDGKFVDGTSFVADENYIKESILEPAKHVVEGYMPVMPSFAGQLTDDEIDGLIAFIKAQDGTKVAAPVAAAPKADDAAEFAKLSPVERGERWIKQKAVPACVSCHSLDGSKLVGPSFKGIYMQEHEMEGGNKVIADDAYIAESILNPGAKIVKGYAPAMPPVYASGLKEQDIKDIIEYIKTLK